MLRISNYLLVVAGTTILAGSAWLSYAQQPEWPMVEASTAPLSAGSPAPFRLERLPSVPLPSTAAPNNWGQATPMPAASESPAIVRLPAAPYTIAPPNRAIPPGSPISVLQAPGAHQTSFTQPPQSASYEDLQRRLGAAEAEVSALRQQVLPCSGQAVIPASAVTADMTESAKPVPTLSERIQQLEKDFSAQKTPKYPTARLTGFFQFDAGFYSQDANSVKTFNSLNAVPPIAALTPNGGHLQNGVDFRRARLAGTGNLAENNSYYLEMDFAAAGRPSFMDVWDQLEELPVLGNVRIGQFRQPFSIDSLNSVRQLMFLERSLPFQAFVPFRRDGVMSYDNSEDKLTTWAFSGYRTGGFNNQPLGDSRFGTDLGNNGGWSVGCRATHLLWYDEPADGRYLLHVGGGYAYGNIDGPAGKFYEARAVPEFFLGDAAIVTPYANTSTGTPFFPDTGRIRADDFHLFGVELAGVAGPLTVQSEYMQTLVNQTDGPQQSYSGAYCQVGWFLTGEHRPYNRALGVFDRVKPFTNFFYCGHECGGWGWGAWELCGRWSWIDLNSTFINPVASPGPHLGGRLTDLTAGLNWYWNPYAKLQFNYIYAMLDRPETNGIPSNTSIFAIRNQIDF